MGEEPGKYSRLAEVELACEFFLPITSLPANGDTQFCGCLQLSFSLLFVSLLNCFLPECYITAYTILSLTFPDIP